MSRRHDLQDATGVIAAITPAQQVIVVKKTTPTNTDKGYATGCIWINYTGGVGTALYVNVGSNTSATWVNIA